MKRILFYSLAAAAVCGMAMSNADAATRKHHPAGHYKTVAAKLKKVSSHQLLVGEPAQTSLGRPIAGEGSIDRDGWRRSNGSWDNTCFRTLNYLPSESACSGGGI
jgi:hypothetical protein